MSQRWVAMSFRLSDGDPRGLMGTRRKPTARLGTDLALQRPMTARRATVERSSWDDISDDVVTNVDGAAVTDDPDRTSLEGFVEAGNTLDLYVDDDPSSGFSTPSKWRS